MVLAAFILHEKQKTKNNFPYGYQSKNKKNPEIFFHCINVYKIINKKWTKKIKVVFSRMYTILPISGSV